MIRLFEEYVEFRKTGEVIKNLEVDPLTESKKRKTVAVRGKLKRPDIDPLGEEDWGWDTDFDDSDFTGNFIIFKKKIPWEKEKQEYYVSVLASHYETISDFDGKNDLNRFKRRGILIPLTEKEIERLKRNKLGMIPIIPRFSEPRNDFGGHGRLWYTDLEKIGKKVYYLDRYYFDNYLYLNECKNQ
jgi:hypothetical protein